MFYSDIIRFKNDVLSKWPSYIVTVAVWGFPRELPTGVESHTVNVSFPSSRGSTLSSSRVK